MSNANVPGSDEGVKEGLGRLASTLEDAERPVIAPGEAAESAHPPDKADEDKTLKRALLWKRARWASVSILLLFVAAVGAVCGVFLRNPSIRTMAWNILTHGNDVITKHGFDITGTYKPSNYFPLDKRKSLTVLVLGVDHDYAGKRPPGHNAVPTGPVPNAPGRSDAIMVARFEFDGDSIRSLNVLSIPRDTRVRIPGHGIHKINAAHAYGGPELSMATIQDVFGITPDYYADLNFEGFQQVVDAVGGVDINVHQKLNYDDNWGNLHVHLKPGMQHLNGYKAMGYVRIRHDDDDLARAQRQHEFIEALRSRIVSPTNFMKLPDLVGAITNNLHSSLNEGQMLTLANLARKAPKDAICVDTLPVIEGKVFVYIDRRKSENVIRKMFFPDKQVADLPSIKMPDGESGPPRRRRRHVREPGSAPSARHQSVPEQTSPVPASTQEQQPKNQDAPSGETEPATEKPAARDSSSGAEKPPPATPPKSESTTESDGGKAKSKEGPGTTSGNTSTILRG